MSRLIQTNGAGKERESFARAIVLALRQLAQKSSTDKEAYDLVAFMILSLEGIARTVQRSADAWEKRGYWVKADRFRMDWIWAEVLGRELRLALENDDWAKISQVSIQIGEKLSRVKIPKRFEIGQPWKNAARKLKDDSQKNSAKPG